MSGILYAIGVGPGDPELMTLKALRILRQSGAAALPGPEPRATAAYQIAVQACPQLAQKRLLALPLPMTRDPDALAEHRRQAVQALGALLDAGEQVAFLTLGDPTLYSTYLYLHRQLLALGYQAQIVSGVPSFCAAAARLDLGLAEGEQPLHIIPALSRQLPLDQALDLPGVKVLMKTGGRAGTLRDALLRRGQEGAMVEGCGMPGERVYPTPRQFPDQAGYFSLAIVKE